MRKDTVLFSSLLAVGMSAALVASAATLTFSVANPISLTVRESMQLTVSGGSGSGYSVSSNTNPSAISASVNGTSITLYASSAGSADIMICDGTGSACGTLVTTTGSASSNSANITFSPSTLTVGISQAGSVTLSGATNYFVSKNSNPGITTHSLAGSVITVTGSTGGSTVLTICAVENTAKCADLSVTVGATTTTSSGTTVATGAAVGFSVASPASVGVGQNLSVNLSGATAYYIAGYSNPIPVQATISGSVLTITGVTSGSTSVNICVAGSVSQCGALAVNVGTAATATPAQAATTVAPVVTTPTPVTTPAQAPTMNAASLLTAIQTMQNQLAQMLLVIQTMQAQLSQLAGTVTPTASVPSYSTGASFDGTFVSLLTLNSTGVEVAALQKILIKEGYLSGSATGFFGPATQSALKKYQAAHGVDAVGYTGPSTRAVLNGR